nr:proline-rich protein 36-like [Aegilops tauschii subsp. strangulata]
MSRVATCSTPRWPASSRGYATPPFAVALSVSTPLGLASLLRGVGSGAVRPVAAPAARLRAALPPPRACAVDPSRPRALLAPSSSAARRLRPPLLCPCPRGPVRAQAGPRRSTLARANPSLSLAAPSLPRSTHTGSARRLRPRMLCHRARSPSPRPSRSVPFCPCAREPVAAPGRAWPPPLSARRLRPPRPPAGYACTGYRRCGRLLLQ